MHMRERVEAKIASLLEPIVDKRVDAESYELALHELTELAILGTMPVNCEPRDSEPALRKNDV